MACVENGRSHRHVGLLLVPKLRVLKSFPNHFILIGMLTIWGTLYISISMNKSVSILVDLRKGKGLIYFLKIHHQNLMVFLNY